jgi:type II secretory pathway pseudopilin PulG
MRRTSYRQLPGYAARRQAGFMLLLLMLAVAVMTIMALRVAQSYRHRIQRDREVEMIHRGVQYARAVKRYYRKFGVYPTSIEQLEETNKIRFLRKRYEDPMATDGKWKIAHLNDIKLPGIEGIMKTATNTAPGTAANSSGSSKSGDGEDG